MRRILDAGCGRGEFLQEKFSWMQNIEVYGVDISPEFIKDAVETSPRHFRFKICALEKLDFPDGYFDEVYCHDVLEHVEDYPRALENICRVLKPAGHLHLVIPDPVCEKIIFHFDPLYCSSQMHRRVIPSWQIKEDLEKRGFVVVKCQKLMMINALMAIYRAMRRLPVEPQSGLYTKPQEIAWIYRIFGPFYRLKLVQWLDGTLLVRILAKKYVIEAIKK
ncbi:2-polyprenyl-6-hydroxyphenyl methylase / 3-demethylubiquinone-9 3-methyltransferase [Candidatus Hakubella thermalkaliphila]|uniref:2-polyprenyl-6-hydroxyphenyl methylase / 3-demethylubiquinone-9 3-methyltransferase n=1 Tax=Candidatus Hakubella thermalkaliphila TaxID=2754717 RepID=A0A6V8PJ14_9ACTN|nr:2-polyprenyl-6-hydroxyphenyl methylase / 3-demethylubiquinone-9 3-methyltransferase [Candidatus Hakubella thermalkaliphila]GFP43524.1 2-polyprenyl-6-hydroxyphenyl methylase / 3-demethylubiquinone-9 3-methyltransferase [Candidatus Hakubella thermalkaliphila]